MNEDAKGRTAVAATRNQLKSSKQNFLKRRSFEQGRAEVDAAHRATQRLYCDALRLWRRCSRCACKRHRRCLGDPTHCLTGGLMFVPPSKRLKARQQVLKGGRRRLPPATHIEWTVRRCGLVELVSWSLG
jgi:hypothetical protein